MARRGSNRLLRWADGPGRESGSWLLVAAAVASIPFLNLLRPPCSTAECISDWDKVFFVPKLLFIPALLAVGVLAGSWIAQRLHGRTHKRFHATLEDRDAPDIPPGHFRAKEMERDILRRSYTWMGIGSASMAGVFVFFTGTTIGRRTCDPWRFSQPTGLGVCNSPGGWSDMLMAYQVWLMVLVAAIAGLWMLIQSRRYVDRSKRRLPFGRRKAQGHP